VWPLSRGVQLSAVAGLSVGVWWGCRLVFRCGLRTLSGHGVSARLLLQGVGVAGVGVVCVGCGGRHMRARGAGGQVPAVFARVGLSWSAVRA
jgi:hypothetical protein